jgi:hypothetical protein
VEISGTWQIMIDRQTVDRTQSVYLFNLEQRIPPRHLRKRIGQCQSAVPYIARNEESLAGVALQYIRKLLQVSGYISRLYTNLQNWLSGPISPRRF